MLGRLKFEISNLVNQVLDQLPKEVWSSSVTTFLDPSMGGGQFVRAIESRLRKYGHSDSNIANRVFGYESNVMRVRFAVNKYKLIGTYVAKDLVKEPTNMQFDVVIGNPPYKNKNETGGASSLWRKVITKSWGLLKDNGTMAMVTPRLANTSNDIGYIFTDFQVTTVFTDVAKHFPGVGSSFYAWVAVKSPKTKAAFFVDENISIDLTKDLALPKDIAAMPIMAKLSNNVSNFECTSSKEYLHTSIADGSDEAKMTRYPVSTHPFKLRRTSGKNYYVYGSVEPTDYYANKVVMTFSGNPHYQYHSAETPVGTIKFQSGHILVKDQEEGENLIHLFNSLLYRFLISQKITGGMRGRHFYEMPKMDLSVKWSDSDLYKHFGLTQEEIDYVEANS